MYGQRDELYVRLVSDIGADLVASKVPHGSPSKVHQFSWFFMGLPTSVSAKSLKSFIFLSIGKHLER